MKTSSPDHQEIARKAYQIYVRNGCKHGHAMEHWLEAEEDLAKLNSGAEIQTLKAKNGNKEPAATSGAVKRKPAAKKAVKSPK